MANTLHGKFVGVVDDAGGGIITIVASRATVSYPPTGAFVEAEWSKEIVLAHEHQWTVFFRKSNADTLTLFCEVANCTETKEVPNHFLKL